MLDIILSALGNLFSDWHILYLLGGVLLGLMVGIIPGLGGTVGMSLVVPFVFGMDPTSALAMMVGLLAVVATGDTITSVLMGIPGSAASQATVLDGFPLAKQGQAARALSAAFTASMYGGVLGALILTAAILVARPVILAFGTGEMLMLTILGLSMVGVLSGASMLKGLIATGMGMILGVVGPAPATGEYRLIFGSLYLSDGLPLVVVALGIFAVPEVIDLLRRNRAIAERPMLGQGWLVGPRDMFRNIWLCTRCASIGCLVGSLPGLGGSVVDWIAYGHAVQSTRDRERFGQGDIRGVLAPESANNATQGGALVPTLIFGIPGSGSTAVFLGGLILLGIQPGLAMVESQLDITYTIIWSLALANIFGAGICFLISGQVARLTTIPYVYLAPFMVTILFFAAYQSTRDWGDLLAMFAIGVFATYMRRFGYPRPAILIGFVLQRNVETYLYQTVQFYDFSQIVGRPIFLALIAITALSVYVGMRFRPSYSTEGESARLSAAQLRPQIFFALLLAAIAGYTLYEVWRFNFLGKIFPVSAALITLAFLAGALVVLWRGDVRSPVVFDAEADWNKASETYAHSLPYYLYWIAGFLVGAWLVGFVLAVVLFFFVFLLSRSKARLWSIALMAASALAFLALISHLLVLDFPRGYLQDFVTLPWPFG